MFFLKKLAYRTVQLTFRAVLPLLPYREPTVISSCDELGKVLLSERATSVLILTSKSIVKNGLVACVESALNKSGVKYVIYEKVRPDPTVENVNEALSVYRENACDSIIAIGGGSVMDCAKAVGACVAYPRRELKKMVGVMRVLRRTPTIIAIPTTAGTGSEATLAAVITDTETHGKYAMMSFSLIPRYAVLDEKFTYSLPPHMTATTGMDALTHAVEAYIGRSTTKKTRALALEATRLIFENVEKAYADGYDREARKNMLIASYKAGVAFSESYVGYVHAIAHSVGGRYGTPHGFANAVIMPHVLEAYGRSAHKKLHALGVAAGACSARDSLETGAEKFINAIRELNARMDIASTISEIEMSDIGDMARLAEKEANPLYPVPKLMTEKELERVYYKIFGKCEKAEVNEK